MFEEVEIPPSEPMAVGFQERPVYISELDEVSGQRSATTNPLMLLRYLQREESKTR